MCDIFSPGTWPVRIHGGCLVRLLHLLTSTLISACIGNIFGHIHYTCTQRFHSFSPSAVVRKSTASLFLGTFLSRCSNTNGLLPFIGLSHSSNDISRCSWNLKGQGQMRLRSRVLLGSSVAYSISQYFNGDFIGVVPEECRYQAIREGTLASILTIQKTSVHE